MAYLLPLVGRQGQLAELQALAREAAAGQGRVVLLGGEAGVGKSTLVEALVREAGGLLAVSGGCPGPDETLPFGPWLDTVRRLCRELECDAAALPPPFGQAPGEWRPQEVAAALAGWLGSRERPLLVILEDIHWADPASLELLRYLPAYLRDIAVLAVASYRSDELHRRHPLWTLLPELERAGAHRISLDRLSAADVTELTAAILPDRQDAAALAARLYQRSRGNPLFVRELILAAARSGAEAGDGGEPPLPETVQQAIDTKLARLRPEALTVLQAAAVIGERFAYDLLAQVVEEPEDALLEVLETAMALHVIRPDGPGGDRFGFDHALVREALIGQLIGPRRRRWHARVAAALLAEPRPDVEALAFHLVRAGDRRAVDYLRAAGDRALSLGALVQAGERFEAALAQVPQADRRRGELLLKLGWSLRWGDRQRALACWEEALQAAEAGGNRAVAVWARHMQAAFDWNRADLLQELAAVQTAEETLLADPEYLRLETQLWGECAGYPRIGAVRATVLILVGEREAGRELLQALEVRARPGVSHALPNAGVFLALSSGRPQAAAELAGRAVETALAQRDYREAVRHQTNRLFLVMLSRADEPDLVDATADRLAELESESLARCGYAFAAAGASMRDIYRFFRGAWPGTADNFLKLLQATPGNNARNICWVLSRSLLALDDLEGTRTLLACAAPHHPSDPPAPDAIEVGLHCVHACLHVARGDLQQARPWLETAQQWQERRRLVLTRAEVHLARAHYLRRAGDREAAWQAAQQALALAEALPVQWWMIEARRLLGELAADLGRPQAAAEHLAAALDLAGRCALVPEVALTQLVRGRLLPDAPGALEGLRTARDTFGRLGATHALAAVEALLARSQAPGAPAAAGGGRSAGAAREAGLTEREVEVIALVAQGLTDKEVAARLFISRKTVDGHLRNIFNKVGVSNRAALAAYAARTGLVH